MIDIEKAKEAIKRLHHLSSPFEGTYAKEAVETLEQAINEIERYQKLEIDVQRYFELDDRYYPFKETDECYEGFTFAPECIELYHLKQKLQQVGE